MQELTLTPEDAGQICTVLLTMSGYAAMERDSSLIEPRDLVKAIYIVDLEHVSKFWDDWECFETLVSQEKLGNGLSIVHINRFLYLSNLYSLMKEDKQLYPPIGTVSPALKEIFVAARRIAAERAGVLTSPTTRDLLYCICMQDAELSAALRKSGLHLEELTTAVRKSQSC